MFCTNCGSAVAEGQGKCPVCGAPADQPVIPAPSPVSPTQPPPVYAAAPSPVPVTSRPAVSPAQPGGPYDRPPAPGYGAPPSSRPAPAQQGYPQTYEPPRQNDAARPSPSPQQAWGAPPPAPQPQTQPQPQRRDQPSTLPPAGKIMSVWGYLGSMILMGIPVAGIAAAVILALGAVKNRSLVNLARAWLLASGIVLALCFGFVLILSLAFPRVYQEAYYGILDFFTLTLPELLKN